MAYSTMLMALVVMPIMIVSTSIFLRYQVFIFLVRRLCTVGAMR